MDEFIRQYFEKNALIKNRELISYVQFLRLISIVHHVFFIIIGTLSFIVLIMTQFLAEKFPYNNSIIIVIGIFFVGLLLITCQFIKRHPRFLSYNALLLVKIKNYIIKAKYEDFFYFYFGSLLILLYLPLVILLFIAIINYNSWLTPLSKEYLSNVDSIKIIISFSGAIIASQIALFTFMFGQLLGKYSSKIAGAINKHRVVLLLWCYQIILLLILFSSYRYGYPKIIQGVFIPFLIIENIICLIFTIIVANTGIHAERAIVYAGKRFSKRIRKYMKPAIHYLGNQPNSFWKFLGILGLDWRNPERLKFYEPPSRGVALANSYLSSLFNAANKAIHENQQELLSASLIAIWYVLETYTEIRRFYYGSKDIVLGYTNDQMAALLKASSRSPNEYMIVDVVKYIGSIGCLSLQISVQPETIVEKISERMIPKEHSLSFAWLNLLGEGFEHSYSLMRSTAASEAIHQLHLIALKACNNEYYSVVTDGYIPTIQIIHQACILHPDVYRMTLAGDCIRKHLMILAHTATNVNPFGDVYDTFDVLIESIEKMATNQFVVQKLPQFNFSDPGNVITLKIEKESFILQDIFYFTLSRKFSERWKQSATVDDLKQIIHLLVNLTKSALNNKVIGQGGYVEALYEIGYFILRGLPEQYKPIKDLSTIDLHEEMKKLYKRENPSYQQILEEELFKAWVELFPLVFKAFEKNHYHGREWQQNFFGILGIGMIGFLERKDENLKSQLRMCAQQFMKLIIRENEESGQKIWEEWWDYLQLLGAWIYYFLEEKSLGKDIAKYVAEGRPFSIGLGRISKGGQFGPYGYPVIMHNDFFLPWLRNLQPQEYLSNRDWEVFHKWQQKIMNPEMLLAFYKIVEEFRAPLEEEFYREIEQTRKKKNNN